MTNYLKSLARRSKKEDPGAILAHVAESFAEAPLDSPARKLPKARRLYELVRFAQMESIVPWLRDEPAALKRILAFTRKIKDKELSTILASAVAGVSQGPATMTVSEPGQVPQVIDLSQHMRDMGIDLDTSFNGEDWGGTDLAISLSMENYEAAVLAELINAADAFELKRPWQLQHDTHAKRLRTQAMRGLTAIDLFQELIGATKPQLEVGYWEREDERKDAQGVHINIKHALNPPVARAALTNAHKQFGPAAQELLDLYALHNGGELFRYRRQCGFVLAPMEEWAELHASAVEWAEIAWPKEDMPHYFYTAIAFGKIPGDRDCWLLITEGKYAGTVMYSDTDSLEEPAFKSMREFLFTLLHDTARILGIGGYVRYQVNGEHLYPMRYMFGDVG